MNIQLCDPAIPKPDAGTTCVSTPDAVQELRCPRKASAASTGRATADRSLRSTLGCRLPLFAAVLFCAASLQAADSAAQRNWPQWRGPLGVGISPTADPPIKWSESENVRWKVKVPGFGTATPIVWDKFVFVQSAIPTGKKVESPAEKSAAAADDKPATAGPTTADAPRKGRAGGRSFPGMAIAKPDEIQQFVLVCLNRANGEVLWQKVAREEVPHEGHHPDHGFASSSPLTDGQFVFAYFGSRGLHCYDLQGNLKWEKDFGRMQTKFMFGEGSSPALFGNTIVVNWDHEGDDFIVALDKRTGDELWRQPRDEETSWATPLVVEHDGRAQVITSGSKKIRSYDLESGKLIWECAGLHTNAIPSPVADQDMVYLTCGYRKFTLEAIRLGRTGDLSDTDAIAWTHNKSTPYVPSPLLYDKRLYFLSANNAILSCCDATDGHSLMEPTRLEGVEGVYASPVGAAERIYVVGRNGATLVIRNSDKLEVLATNQLDDRFDASPALVGREILLRGHENLYCIGEK